MIYFFKLLFLDVNNLTMKKYKRWNKHKGTLGYGASNNKNKTNNNNHLE